MVAIVEVLYKNTWFLSTTQVAEGAGILRDRSRRMLREMAEYGWVQKRTMGRDEEVWRLGLALPRIGWMRWLCITERATCMPNDILPLASAREPRLHEGAQFTCRLFHAVASSVAPLSTAQVADLAQLDRRIANRVLGELATAEWTREVAIAGRPCWHVGPRLVALSKGWKQVLSLERAVLDNSFARIERP